MEEVTLSWIIVKSNEMFVLQCLEHDIAAQGETAAEAILAFEQIVATWMYGMAELGWESITTLPAAPVYFQRMVA